MIAPTLALLSILGALPTTAWADAYEDGLAEARRLDAQGDLAGAARVLEPLAARYPEDVALALQTAWTWFRLGRYRDAERGYRAVLVHAPTSTDALAGLGWSLARQERCDEARAPLAAALAIDAGYAPARAGVAACAPPPTVRFSPTLSLTGHYYQDNPSKAYALSLFGGLDLLIVDRWRVGAAFRFSDFTPPGDIAHGKAQYEVYGHAGYDRHRWGVAVQYAWLDDATGFSGTSHHVGASARYSRFGDATLALSTSFFSDATVLRAELAWLLPLGRGFSLRPSAVLQWARTDQYGSGVVGGGGLTAAWTGARGGVFLGGKYGEEFRAAYLTRQLVMNIPERITWGAWAGGEVYAGRGVTLGLAYEYDRLRRTDVTANADEGAHFLVFTVAGSWPRPAAGP